MNIKENVLELVGNTPLVKLNNYSKDAGLETPLIAKLEYFNPTGSVKDRIAKEMILEGERQGKLIPGTTTLIEPTSGNTGIGLASMGRSKGYRVIIVMPDSMSVERRKLMKAYGAELVLTPGAKGMAGAIEEAARLEKEIENAVVVGQFVNMANPAAHYGHTGPEIYEDTEGQVDIFVAGVGTGGTVSGVGKYLKEKIPGIKIIAVEPSASPVLSKGEKGSHKIQGIGAGFVPKTLDTEIYDEVFPVGDSSAFEEGKKISRLEGISVGISSGAALYAAKEIAKRPENKGKNIVVLLPDSGDRYLSTPLFEE